MKAKNILFLSIAVVLLTTSSRCVHFSGGVTPSKNYITRDFKVTGFDKLDLGIVADIEYTQSTDSSTSLQIYGSNNLVELVNVDVKDNALTLSMKKKSIHKTDLKISISSPHLQSIKTRGAGDFIIKDRLETTCLKIKNEGVGSIKLNNISCQELDLSTEGVGDVYIQGKAEKASLISQGVGDIDADGLESKSVIAASNGVGSISCHATQSINAKVNGVGSISYKGNPTDRKLKKNGVGSIKQK